MKSEFAKHWDLFDLKGPVCPSCGSDQVQLIYFQGRPYPQCRRCKFWTTEVEATWLPKTS